jgi:hypothetical protein
MNMLRWHCFNALCWRHVDCTILQVSDDFHWDILKVLSHNRTGPNVGYLRRHLPEHYLRGIIKSRLILLTARQLLSLDDSEGYKALLVKKYCDFGGVKIKTSG